MTEEVCFVPIGCGMVFNGQCIDNFIKSIVRPWYSLQANGFPQAALANQNAIIHVQFFFWIFDFGAAKTYVINHGYSPTHQTVNCCRPI